MLKIQNRDQIIFVKFTWVKIVHELCVIWLYKYGGGSVSASSTAVHVNTLYLRKFSKNYFICIVYFNVYCETHI